MRIKHIRQRDYSRLLMFGAALVVLIGICLATCNFISDKAEESYDVESGMKQSAKYTHIMVMGVDRRSDDVGRSDTLMVVTVNNKDGKAGIISIPRDTRTAIEGNGYDKINHAYAYGDVKLTKQSVEKLLGVKMDYYVLIDVHAFERIIDALDGIDLDVEKRMYYEDPWDDDGGLIIDLLPGEQHLDGDKAIQYVRYRDAEGDLGRITRQQHFMKAVMDKVLSPSVLPKLPTIVEEIRSALDTDMPLPDMISFAKMAPEIKDNGLKSEMLPGAAAYYDGVSYWIPNIVKLREMVAEQMDITLSAEARSRAEKAEDKYRSKIPEGLRYQDEAGNIEPLKKSEVQVRIVVENGRENDGDKMADALRKLGFNVISIEAGTRANRRNTIIKTERSSVDMFYGMPFDCTIYDEGKYKHATIYVGSDFDLEK